MIRYCLETIECDPDRGIESIEKQTISLAKSIVDKLDKTTETQQNVDETSIFSLLRTTSCSCQTIEHPLEIFLRKTKNINVLHHKTQRTPLLEAIYLQQHKTINMLLQQSSCDINLATSTIPSERQQTPLIVACRSQSLSIIRDLLNHPKCELLVHDDQQNQAFHYFLATSNRSDEYLEIFHLFIDKLKSIDKRTLNSQGKLKRIISDIVFFALFNHV